jgi:hypothetical protein
MAVIRERSEPDPVPEGGSPLVLAPLAFVLGGASGLVGAFFRMALDWADRCSGFTIEGLVRHGARRFGWRNESVGIV